MKKSLLYLGLGGLLMSLLTFLLRLIKVSFLSDVLTLFVITLVLSTIVVGFGVFSKK